METKDILKKLREISIHSLVKRETFACYSGLSEIPYFNPLPRKEGDMFRIGIDLPAGISIHSLVKRETSKAA